MNRKSLIYDDEKRENEKGGPELCILVLGYILLDSIDCILTIELRGSQQRKMILL